MQFTELIAKRRSIRKYREVPVALETIEEIIRESTLAPNAGNEQPWKFVVVQSKEMIARISAESKGNILARINADPNHYAARYRKMLENDSFNVFFNAPSLVLLVGPAQLKNIQIDCALAAGYLMLAATARGLGSCWVNLGAAIEEPELRDALGIPADFAIVAPIALGYPERIPAAPARRPPGIVTVLT